MKKEWVKAITSLIIISIVILTITIIFLENRIMFGLFFLILGIVLLLLMKLFRVKIKAVYSDLTFGFIDESLLVIASTIGGLNAGVVGAIVGGVTGNVIADGISGLFEGNMAERMKKHHIKEDRTAFATMLGKITGCLIGAGIILILIWTIRIFL